MIHIITPEQFTQAQETVKILIETIFHFEYEKDFLNKFCKVNPEFHEIERVHMSGSVFRVTIKREDGREQDLYINSYDVYSWYTDIGEQLKEKMEK